MTNRINRNIMIGGIFVILLLFNITNVTTARDSNLSLSSFSDWEDFSYDPTSVEDQANKAGGIFVFIGQEGYLYDVVFELDVTHLGSTVFLGPDSVNIIGSVLVNIGDTAQFQAVIGIDTNETGMFSYIFEDVAIISLLVLAFDSTTGDTVTGRYRMDTTVTLKPPDPPKESLFSADNLELLATVVGSIATVIAVLFALSRYNRGRKFRKDVDIYLLNKDMSLRDVTGQNDKKYLKLKKHLSERSLLRDSDM